jgi:hypothetical protein
MLLGRDYLEVQRAASRIKGWEQGLNVPEVIRVGKRIGCPLARLAVATTPEWEDMSGILFCRRSRHHHAVVLFCGVVYDPSDGVLWELDAFLAVTLYRPYTLLIC